MNGIWQNEWDISAQKEAAGARKKWATVTACMTSSDVRSDAVECVRFRFCSIGQCVVIYQSITIVLRSRKQTGTESV